jgi:hypothetical protein
VSLVFLSHSPDDEAEAAEVCESLRHAGLNVWWDAKVPGDTNWATELGRALETCEAMVLLVSPAAVASDLVRRELQYARSRGHADTTVSRLDPTYVGGALVLSTVADVRFDQEPHSGIEANCPSDQERPKLGESCIARATAF